MLRYAEKDLKSWYSRKDRPPLIIRGARQVGKSTLVKQFARNQNLDLIEINFELLKLQALMKEELSIDDILLEIEAKSKKKITSNSLIFFDELQVSPKAIQSLRYFYELKPQIAIIGAGSLLDLVLNEEEISFPVGRVQFYYLGPMTFTEFLWALGEDSLSEKLEQDEFFDFLHDQYSELLKKYLFIGGMPKVIQTFIDSQSMLEVSLAQGNLVQTYKADFPKYGKRINTQRLDKIFESVPRQVGRKVIYQNFDQDSKAREIKRALELLQDARVITPCYHSAACVFPLKAGVDDRILKYYFLDIGLLNYFHQLDWSTFISQYQSFFLTKGTMAEQFVAQHLCFFRGSWEPPELYYWLKDKSSQKAEVDFLVGVGHEIWPIEVKSEGQGQLQSLKYFCAEKNILHGIKISQHFFKTMDMQRKITQNQNSKVISFRLHNIPLYAIEALPRLIRKWQNTNT